MKRAEKIMSKVLLPFVVASIALVLVLSLTGATAQDASAGAITNHWTHTVADGATSYITTGGNLTGWDVSGYGNAVLHVIADASNTTSTLTIYPQYSNAVVNCTTVTDWFTGTDKISYSNVGTLASTVAISAGGGTTVTTSYTYNSASAGYTEVAQSMSLTGDAYAGRDFNVYGRCMRLSLAVSFGTITPTIYVQERDFYQ